MRIIAAFMLLAALATPAVAARGWNEASSKHFIIYSQEAPDKLQRFATQLERFDKSLRNLFDTPDPDVPPATRLTIYVLGDAAAVRRLARGRNAAGFYRGHSAGPVAYMSRSTEGSGDWALTPQVVLLHEYTHHFMLHNFPAAYPPWFIEGFAEFNATARFLKDGGVGLGLPAKHRAYSLVTDNGLPLREILVPTKRRMDSAEVESIYARGWLLTHYLTFDKARKGQLGAYLKAIASGTPAAKAAETFGDLRTLDRELRAYLNGRTMSYFAMEARVLPIGEVRVRALSPAESAIMPARLHSKSGVDEKEAAAVLLLARKAAAPWPNDPFVQGALAEAEFDAGNDAEADAAADRALAAAPNDVQALIYKSFVAMRRARTAGTPAAWKEARRWIMRANRADPGHPLPLQFFYQSFLEAGEKPKQNAIDGLMLAQQLAPQDDALRLLLAHQLIELEKTEQARSILAPVAYAPHASGAREAARKLLAEMPGGEAAPAVVATAD